MDMQLLSYDIVHYSLLDDTTQHELATSQDRGWTALFVVVASSYLAGFGGLLWTFVSAQSVDHARFFARSFLLGSALQVLAFFAWVAITALLLQHLHGLHVSMGAVYRLMGYAFAAMSMQLFIVLPVYAQPIGIISLAATFVIATAALREVTAASAFQAFSACLAGFAVFCCILGLLGHGQRNLAPGIFALSPNSLSVGLALPAIPR